MASSNPQPVFQPIGKQAAETARNAASNRDEISVDGAEKFVEQIESLCMNCHKQGMTRLLLTVIPHFREVIIMSFRCDHCGFANNEVQAAGTIQPKGASYELRLTQIEDMSRQVVKSDTASVKFVELDLEVPAGRGQLTNVEGLLQTVVDDLEYGQADRLAAQPDAHAKIAAVIIRARAMIAGNEFPFRLLVNDPAGNSFISSDLIDGVGKLERREYNRTTEQNALLGLSAASDALAEAAELAPDEVYSLTSTCPGCSYPCLMNNKMVDIPHFKQVLIMSIVCDACGYRSNEVKTGGAVPARGERVSIAVRPLPAPDLARDILKSETCHMSCPQLQLELSPGTLGGRFTTVEGLLTQVRDELRGQIYRADSDADVLVGDSIPKAEHTRWTDFFARLDEAIAGNVAFDIILTDPMAASYVQPLVDPPEPDPQIVREQYDRTEEENEDLGLLDMKTEGYEEPEAAQAHSP